MTYNFEAELHEKGMIEMITITSLDELKAFLASMPEGTTSDILASDLEAGNFEIAHFVRGDGFPYDVRYTGPVAEGYKSPFEMVSNESDL